MSKKEVLTYLERISNVMKIAFRQHLAREGFQLVQFETLSYLANCNKYSNSPQHVAEYLGLTKGTVSQTINHLDALGLLKKNVDPRDRRKLHIVLTARGKHLVARFENIIKFEPLEGQDIPSEELLAESLNLILKSLQRANGYKTFGACRTCLHHQVTEGQRLCLLTQEALTDIEKDLICYEHTPHSGSQSSPVNSEIGSSNF